MQGSTKPINFNQHIRTLTAVAQFYLYVDPAIGRCHADNMCPARMKTILMECFKDSEMSDYWKDKILAYFDRHGAKLYA